MSNDFMTRNLARSGWLAWVIIILCVGYGVIAGWQMDMNKPPEYAWLDACVTALCVFAVAAITVTQAVFDSGTAIGRLGRWMALLGFTVLASRFVYAEALLGEVPVHPASMAAVGAIALSIIFRQVEIWADSRHA